MNLVSILLNIHKGADNFFSQVHTSGFIMVFSHSYIYLFVG